VTLLLGSNSLSQYPLTKQKGEDYSYREMGLSFSLPGRARIAIVELFGVIGGSHRTARYVDTLSSLRNSKRVKAVILKVDSPGGSAGASDCLYSAITKLSAQKPVVAFISGTATSGAYLASCAATKIVAVPSSIVGSIGVISIRPILLELLHKVGIQIAVTKSGQFKDMGAFYRLPTTEEEQREQDLIDQIQDNFISAVAESRHLDLQAVRQYATGEVFMAPRAKQLGLIDEVGDFEVALDIAAQLGKVPRRPFYIRRQKTLTERLLSRVTSSKR